MSENTMRPYVDFHEVKTAISIPEVMQILGIANQFRRRGDTLAGVCPLPEHLHGPSPNSDQFKISQLDDGVWVWHCFGDCQRGGDVIEFVRAMTGLSHAHVRFWFAEHFGDRLRLTRPTASETTTEDVDHSPLQDSKTSGEVTEPDKPETAIRAPLKPLRFRLRLDPNCEYLHRRGVRAKTIQRYGLGLCSKGLLAGYVAIPVYRYPREDPDENPVAYLGRWPGDDFDADAGRPRYKWPEGFEKSRVVYGLQEALASTADSDSLILVEGPFDVYHLFRHGFFGAVASFGASLSDEQAAILIGTGRSVTVMLDGNIAGKSGSKDAVSKLAYGTTVRAIALLDEQQPDGLIGPHLRDLLKP